MKEMITSSDSKSIESVLPVLSKIAAEGDITYRIATYLIQNGWTYEDWWRESKKLTMLNTALVNNIRNNIQDISKGFVPTLSVYGNVASDMKQQMRRLKRK